MKAVITQIAQAKPGLKQIEFETAYLKAHPAPDSLSPENIRQAYAAYNKAARKSKRTQAKREGTVGPDRIPR